MGKTISIIIIVYALEKSVLDEDIFIRDRKFHFLRDKEKYESQKQLQFIQIITSVYSNRTTTSGTITSL